MKGLGTDEDSIMKLLTSRSNSQRQQIKAAYKTLHGKDLVGDLKGELGGKFETLVVALMTPPILYDVTSLRNAIKGAGTEEKVLIEILSSRTAQQIKDITAAYRQEYDADLEEDVTGDTSGHFRRLLVILLQASRQQGVQEGNVETDAQVRESDCVCVCERERENHVCISEICDRNQIYCSFTMTSLTCVLLRGV
ncbi:annexin A5-like [Coregonus clupeaformis]|uniref:annexin A5-like n=1 Tax=Coregonus clupeaformis TaxID=59861 RepID=UPI001E1C7161|nr:annexin A5-like [Coregonus clupeaformis]